MGNRRSRVVKLGTPRILVDEESGERLVLDFAVEVLTTDGWKCIGHTSGREEAHHVARIAVGSPDALPKEPAPRERMN